MKYTYCELLDILSGNLSETKINPALINQKNLNGDTPLNIAIKLGNTKMAELLINMKVDLESRNKYDRSALKFSILMNNYDIARLLVEKGISDTGTDNSQSSLMMAIIVNNIDIVKLILKSNPELLNSQDKDGFTPLDYASEFGNENIVSFLRDEMHAKRNKYTESALKCELSPKTRQEYYDYKKMINIISSNFKRESIDAKMINTPNAMGFTLLMRAIILNNTEMAKTLIEMGADVNIRNNYNGSCLQWAIRRGMTKIVELLLENDATLDDGTFRNPDSLLLAILYNNSDIVKLLIESGADVNKPNKNQYNPLDYAMEQGNENIIKLLKNSHAKNSEGFISTADYLKNKKSVDSITDDISA